MDSRHGGVVAGRAQRSGLGLLAVMLVLAWACLGASSALAGTTANDNFANAQVLPGASGTVTGTNVGATAETLEPSILGWGGNTIWYSFTTATNGGLSVNTFGSERDTVLQVFTGSTLGSLTLVAENDDWNGLQSKALLNVDAGRTYWIRVQSVFNSEPGAVTLNWNYGARLTSITGHVTDSITNLALGGVWVNVYAPDGSGGWASQCDTASTDASGAYTTGLLAPGRYLVGFSDSGEHWSQYYNREATITAADEVVVSDAANTAGIDAQLIRRFVLAYAAASGGSIEGSATQFVSYGADGTLAIASPSRGYHFTNWSDDSTANPRADVRVTDYVNVTANFAVNTYTLTYGADPHGSLSGSTLQTVPFDGSGTAVSALPSSGYRFVNWSDGSTANPRTDTGVSSNLGVTANFAPTLRVSVSSPRATTRLLHTRNITFKGSVGPPHSTRITIEVQRYTRGKYRAFKSLTVSTSAAGTWSTKLRLKYRGSYRLRAKVPAMSPAYYAGNSSWRTVRVR